MAAIAATMSATVAMPVWSQSPPIGPQSGAAPGAPTLPAVPLAPSRRDRATDGGSGLQPRLDHDSRELGVVEREITVAPDSRGIRLPPGLPSADPPSSPR